MSGCLPGVEPTVQCYGAAIAGCASRGEWRPAIALLREAQAASHQASEHRAISGTLGDSRVMRAVISQAEPLVPSIECYNAALAACEKGGAPDRRVRHSQDTQPCGHSHDTQSCGHTDLHTAHAHAHTVLW